MEVIQELASTLFIIIGVIFMMIAALGILRLPDFYIRMSAITKAGTMGVGLVVVGIAIYFNTLLISAKAFVIVSFMLLTAPVAAHIIARAAYRQGIPFWGKNLIDELGDLVKKRDNCEKLISGDPQNLRAMIEILDYHTTLPPILGGSIRKAIKVAGEIKKIDPAEGHRAYAQLHFRSSQYKLAESEYDLAIRCSGGELRYRLEKGIFYRETGQIEKAFKIFEEIIDEDTGIKEALFEIGKTSALTGLNSKRGEEALARFMNLHPLPEKPELASASCFMGQILLKRRDLPAARKFFEKSLEYLPGFSDSVYYLSRLMKE